jgi:hypothetical protein
MKHADKSQSGSLIKVFFIMEKIKEISKRDIGLPYLYLPMKSNKSEIIIKNLLNRLNCAKKELQTL